MPMESREVIQARHDANEAEIQKLQVAIAERVAVRHQIEGYMRAIEDVERVGSDEATEPESGDLEVI